MKKISTSIVSFLFISTAALSWAETSLPVAEIAKPIVTPANTIDMAKATTPIEKPTTVVTKAHAQSSHSWSYTGQTGPAHWGDLSEKYSTCQSGKNQSPINIDSDAIEADLPAVKFKYNMLTPKNIVNTGHSIQVNMWSGGSINVDNQNFDLKQFHFHTPSENTINGKHAPLEAHFVHLNKAGDIAVVAMLFEPGASDRTLAALVKSMPNNKGETNKLDSKVLKHMEGEFKSSEYFRFNGSLTTPPCTEGVRWIVMRKPMGISDSQLLAFQKALKQPNSRPVQPLNARIVSK